MPAPGNARGERMQHGYAPEGGQKNDSPPLQSGKGVGEIIILLPILGECWLLTIPKALPWADLFLAFLSPLCFESEQARAQAVFTPSVYTPLPLVGVGGDVKPTPALPKGGGIMFFCPSVRNKGVGFYLPSLGERLRVGELRSGNRRSRFACRRMRSGVGLLSFCLI